VRRDLVCRRYGLTRKELVEARRQIPVEARLTREDLVLAALTRNGEVNEGTLSELDTVASFVDWMNHDGCRREDVEASLSRMRESGVLAIKGSHWHLLIEWP
jgi:CRP-like cAMP-binding protein